MGREDRATWKSNYFLKLVVSMPFLHIGFVFHIHFLWTEYYLTLFQCIFSIAKCTQFSYVAAQYFTIYFSMFLILWMHCIIPKFTKYSEYIWFKVYFVQYVCVWNIKILFSQNFLKFVIKPKLQTSDCRQVKIINLQIY